MSTAATGGRSTSARLSLIVIVLALGTAARGSTRWINLGFITFQPSEFGKLLFTLAIAGFLAERARGDASTTIRALGLGAVPVILVMAQPDLGTALVYMAALAAMLFICGTPWRQLAILGTLAVLAIVTVLWAAPAAGVKHHSTPYQKSRLTCFVHPQKCTVDARYNLEQSIAAVGSGQFPRPGPEETQRRRGSTSCPSTAPTSSSRPMASSVASSGRPSCWRSTCSCSGGPCASSRSRAISIRRRWQAASSLRSSSRSS